MGHQGAPEDDPVNDRADGASSFVPMRDASGRVTGIMDRTTAEFLASRNQQPSQASLDAALSQTTRVRVSTDRFRDLDGTTKGGNVLLDVAVPAAIEALRRSLAIVEREEAGHLMTWPTHHVEFLAGEVPIATFGWVIPSTLRWDAAWKGDGELRDETALLDWMADQGRPELRGAYETRRREYEERERRAAENEARWLAAMPACLKPWWETMRMSSLGESESAAARAALETAYPDRLGRIRVLLQWFGSGEGKWNGFASYEAVPESFLLEYPTVDLVAALESGPSPEAELEGAARLFAGSGFRKRWHTDRHAIRGELLARLRTQATSRGDEDRQDRAEAAFGPG